MTQAQVAAFVGLQQPQVAAYENRSKRPSLAMARRLLDAIGVRPSFLLEANRAIARDAVIARFGPSSAPRVFGSVATGTDSIDSDIDVVIVAPAGTGFEDLDDAEAELEAIFGVDVDIVTVGGLHPTRHRDVLVHSVPL